MISKRKLILCQILLANTLRKTMELSLENLYVDGLNGWDHTMKESYLVRRQFYKENTTAATMVHVDLKLCNMIKGLTKIITG